MNGLFRDRVDAGRRLAQALHGYAGRGDVVVLALPRGGVPVAYEVAQALGAKLDVLIVRKLGAPGNPEFAVGAIASGGTLYLDEPTLRELEIGEQQLARLIDQERVEVRRRELAYRGAAESVAIEGKTVIVVDDGVATGATMQAALRALRARHPARLVVAVPVAPLGVDAEFDDVADEFVCVLRPAWFMGIGQFYADFDQTSDDEVRACLDAARGQPRADARDCTAPPAPKEGGDA